MKQCSKLKSLGLLLTTLFLFIGCSSDSDNLKDFYNSNLRAEGDASCMMKITKEEITLTYNTKVLAVLFYTKKGNTIISDLSNSGKHLVLSINKQQQTISVIETNIADYKGQVFHFTGY